MKIKSNYISPVLKIISIFSLLTLTACKDEDKAGQFHPSQVLIQEVMPQNIELEYEYAGRVAGTKEVEVQARVEGIILERKYIEGKAVKQGDILFLIDPKLYQIILKQAQAKLQDSLAHLKQAKRDYERAEELFKRQVITAQNRDNSLYTYEQAKASVKQAEGDVKTAQINLDYTKVVAPITGVTSQESYSEGSLVGGSSGNNLLTRITQLDPVYINFAYPDSDALNDQRLLRQNDPSATKDLKVNVKLSNNSLYPLEGSLNFTDAIIDPATGTVNARALVPNPEMKLLPGQFVRVVVRGIKEINKVIIPEKAIMQGPQGPFVYIADNENKAAIKPVVLGVLTSKGQIINSGLSRKDKVIIEGMIKVRPNQPVQISKQDDQQQKNHK